MKVLTLWQPHAQLIAAGVKTIETRTHDRFRNLAGSRIAIHAASRQPRDDERRAIWRALRNLGVAGGNDVIWQWLWRPPLGVIVATAHVARFRMLREDRDAKAACCHIEDNIYGLVLQNVCRLEQPIRYKGHQGIWNVPDDVIPDYAK